MEKIKFHYDPNKGEAYYLGESVVVSTRNSWTYCQVGTERFIGPGAKTILYNAAKRTSKKRFYELVKNSKGGSKSTMKKVFSHLTYCGTGLFEIKRFGKDILIEVRNSVNAVENKSDKPGCYMLAGYMAGITELITGKECFCEEDKCVAKKDKVCTFRVMVSNKIASPVKGWWKWIMNPQGVKIYMDYNPKKGWTSSKGGDSFLWARKEIGEIKKELIETIGPVNNTLVYELFGKKSAEKGASQMKRFDRILVMVAKRFSKKRMLDKFLEMIPQRGYGYIEQVDYNEKKSTLKLKMKNTFESTNHHETKRPICHCLAGIFAGAACVVFGRNMECEETKCTAIGDKHCEFSIYPERG